MVPYCYLFLLSVFIIWFNDHLSGKELFIRFTMRAFRKLLSIYVFSYFPFGFEGRIWDLILSAPDHCLSFYFSSFYQAFVTEQAGLYQPWWQTPKTDFLVMRLIWF